MLIFYTNSQAFRSLAVYVLCLQKPKIIKKRPSLNATAPFNCFRIAGETLYKKTQYFCIFLNKIT